MILLFYLQQQVPKMDSCAFNFLSKNFNPLIEKWLILSENRLAHVSWGFLEQINESLGNILRSGCRDNWESKKYNVGIFIESTNN